MRELKKMIAECGGVPGVIIGVLALYGGMYAACRVVSAVMRAIGI